MTTTIGSHETALMLHKHFNGDMDNYKRAPKGFRRIGSGCYRTAYLERATDTVYKIGSYSANIHESATSRKLRRKSTRSLGFELVIPRTRTYRTPSTSGWNNRAYPSCVVAQEFAKDSKFTDCDAQNDWMVDIPPCNCKAPLCFAIVHQRIIEFSDLSDIHSSNVLVDRQNRFWLIDMGC